MLPTAPVAPFAPTPTVAAAAPSTGASAPTEDAARLRPRRERRRGILIPAAGTGVVCALVGLVGGSALGRSFEQQAAADAAAAQAAAAEAAKSSLFEDALNKCGASSKATVEDDGRTLILDMRGSKSLSGTLTATETYCVLDALDVPTSVKSLMDTTRALDGRQTGSWGDIEASWSYHPDQGLDIVLTLD